MSEREFDKLLEEVLKGDGYSLAGVHRAGIPPFELFAALGEWANRLERENAEVFAVLEPCVRQSVFFSLIPGKAIDPSYKGNIDAAIREHLAAIRTSLSDEAIEKVRGFCINLRRLHGANKSQARAMAKSLGELRTRPVQFREIRDRQGGRCMWCGADFVRAEVDMTLEHVAPKHIGDDPEDGSNWGLACRSCNEGKEDAFSWAATKWAHDFVPRKFALGNQIRLEHRWTILARSPKCDRCHTSPRQSELFVYKRIDTGLSVPSMCSTICEACARANSITTLSPLWADKERTRVTPSDSRYVSGAVTSAAMADESRR